MEQEQAEKIRTQFLSALDTAAENYKSEQKNNTASSDVKKSIDPNFAEEYDNWDKKSPLKHFTIGVTSDALQSVGVENKKIIWDSSKIIKIKSKHPEMTDLIIKQVPQILENPIVIMQSKNFKSRLTMFGEVYADNKPVLAVLELHPSKNNVFLDEIKLASAYSKDNAQGFINSSNILYIDANKNRVDNWSRFTGLQLPVNQNDINSDNSISNSNENVKQSFTVDEATEEVRELVAVHNITEEKLLKSLQLGGLPMPSVAVMKAKEARGNDVYGDISLVFPKSTIDPQLNTDNEIYGGDAWTPVYPNVEYKINESKADEIYSRAINATKGTYAFKLNSVNFHPSNIEDTLNNRKGESGLIDSFKNDYGMKQFYLAETGEPVKDIKTKEIRTELSDEQAEMYDYLIENFGDTISILEGDNGPYSPPYPPRKWVNEHGSELDRVRRDYYRQKMPDITEKQLDNIFNNLNERPIDKVKLARAVNKYRRNGRTEITISEDYEATEKEIDNRINQKDYERWLNDLFTGIADKKGIRNNLDPYTASGSSRSFEQLHYEETLENVVKQMRTQKNGDIVWFSGTGIWAVAAKNYGTLEQLKSDSGRLQNLSEEEVKEIKESFGGRLDEIAQSLVNKYKNENPFIDYENKMTNIIDGLRISKTKSGVLKYLKEYFKNANESTVDDLFDLVADIGNMPVAYFEAKPQRAVGFNEAAVAIIPVSSSKELKNALAESDVEYIEYDSSDENARLNALNDYLENSGNDVRFSIDVDEFDEAEYNYPKLSGREYGHLRSEIITNYPNVKNTVNCIRLASTNSTYYYILDDDYNLTVCDKRPITNIHNRSENNGIDEFTARLDTRLKGIRGKGRSNQSYNLGSVNGTTTEPNVRLSGGEIQSERRSDGAGYYESGNNADVREEGEKSSIDVDTDVKKLHRENKKLKEANELLKKEFELTGGVGEVYTSSAVSIARHIKKEYGFSMPGTELGKEIKEMVDRIMQDENRSYDDLYSSAHAIAKKAVDKTILIIYLIAVV